MGLMAGLGIGLMQDVLHLLLGQRLAYVDLLRRTTRLHVNNANR